MGEKQVKELKLVMPLRIRVSKSANGKLYPINMNWYRVAHYNNQNAVKIKYKELIKEQIGHDWDLAFEKPYVEFHFYANDNRRQDLRNWTNIAEKFGMDALTELWVIPDDNTSYITETRDVYRGVDKGNGRVEIIITNRA
jgi:hypothetical protein